MPATKGLNSSSISWKATLKTKIIEFWSKVIFLNKQFSLEFMKTQFHIVIEEIISNFLRMFWASQFFPSTKKEQLINFK